MAFMFGPVSLHSISFSVSPSNQANHLYWLNDLESTYYTLYTFFRVCCLSFSVCLQFVMDFFLRLSSFAFNHQMHTHTQRHCIIFDTISMARWKQNSSDNFCAENTERLTFFSNDDGRHADWRWLANSQRWALCEQYWNLFHWNRHMFGNNFSISCDLTLSFAAHYVCSCSLLISKQTWNSRRHRSVCISPRTRKTQSTVHATSLWNSN